MLPPGNGTHTGIWMLSSENKYGPHFLSGEIDIMEVVGRHPYVVYGAMHCQGHTDTNHTKAHGTFENHNIYSEYYDYSIIWDEEGIYYYFDEDLFFEYAPEEKDHKVWPFDQKFHVILSQSVGRWGGTPDEDAYPAVMLIDYAHVYAKK